MRRFVGVAMVVALVAGGCSSGSAEPDESADVVELPGDTSGDTSTTTPSTTAAEDASTTTSQPAPASEAPPPTSLLPECVVGTWELDSERFFEDLVATMAPEEIEGEFTYVSGVTRLVLGPDASFVTQRDMWTFAVASDSGVLELTITDEQSGTYALDGVEMSTLIEASEPPEVTMTVNGEPFVVPGGASPVAPPEAEFSGATVACDGGALVATTEEFSSYWTRR